MWRMRKGWHYMLILLVGFAFFTFQLLRVRSYYVEIKKEKESLEGQVAMLKNEQEAEGGGGVDLLLSPWKALQFFNEKKRFIGEEEEEKDEEPEDAQRRSFFHFFAGWDADKRTFDTYSRNTVPRAMLTRPHHKKHIKAWYVGWPGHNNLGDDLSFSLCRLFLDQLLFSLNRNRSSSPSSSSSTPPVMLTIEYLVPDLAKADAKRERPPEDIDLIILGGGTLISEFYLNFMQQYLMATKTSESDAAVPLLLWGTGWAETASGLLESASFASAKRLSYLLSIRGQQEEAEEKEERKADTEDEGDGVNEGQQQQLMTVVKQEEVEELMTYLYGRRNKRPTGFLWETTEMDGGGEKGKADSTPAIRPVFGGVRGPFTRAMLDWLLPSPRQVKMLHDAVALANEFTYFFELEAEELEADVETLPDIMSTLSAPSPPAYLEQQTAGSSNPLSSHLADALQYFGIMDGVGTALSPQDSYILISWSSRSISYGGRKTFRQVERVLAETALELSKEHWVIFYLVDSSDFLSLKHILKEVHQQSQQVPPPSTSLPRLQRIVFLEASVEEEETLYLMALLKHAKCSIATKLYTAYLSIAAEVPFVSLSYNFKGMELMHTMGLERWNLSWPELDSKEVLLRLIRDLVGKNHHYKFMQKVQEFKQRTREQLRGVLQEELAHWLN